ncbi:MAG: hypothetical protein MJ236_04735 [Clostridia bacterium]|nr:hypothetical protein [Clostridia bacterium]
MINAKELYEFFRDNERMCTAISDCSKCKIHSINCSIKLSTEKELETIINTVNEWKNENLRTRQSEFLKLFPDAQKVSGCLDICPMNLYHSMKGRCDSYKNCNACLKEYWNEIVE